MEAQRRQSRPYFVGEGTANRLLAWGFPFDPSIRMILMLDYYYYRSPHE